MTAPPPPPPPGYDPIDEETIAGIVSGMGARLSEWRDGYARLEIAAGHEIINRQGLVHGGATMTFLDTAAGYAGLWCPYPGRYRRAVTLTLTVNFIAAARKGDALIAEGRVVGGGRTLFYTESVVLDAAGARVATASGVFKYRGAGASLFGDPR